MTGEQAETGGLFVPFQNCGEAKRETSEFLGTSGHVQANAGATPKLSVSEATISPAALRFGSDVYM